ncbi:MAG: DUF805 domain-containing protein [Bacteroidales bacterium]|jgi:uncharacterized membrane protein YhaH (DUF805 family)|nr:DUF805 domain-containing protein [Bacteroidales bacterium]
MKWFIKVLRHYADFRGRARRKEYWMFVLFNFIFLIAWTFVAAFAFALAGSMKDNDVTYIANIISLSYILVMFLPSIAVSVRRLHDLNKSGWWLLIGLIPIAGIWLFVLMVTEGDSRHNRYGANPKTSEETFDEVGRLKSAGITLTLANIVALLANISFIIRYHTPLMDFLYYPDWLGFLALLAAGFLLMSGECNGRMQGKERIALYLPLAATALFVVIGVLSWANGGGDMVIYLINWMIQLICNLSILLFLVLLLFAARNSDLIRITATVAFIFLVIRLLWAVYFASIHGPELLFILIPVAFIVMIRTFTNVYIRQDTNSEYKY